MLGGRDLKVVVVCGRGRGAAALGPAAGATCFVRSKAQIKCILLGSTLVFDHVLVSQNTSAPVLAQRMVLPYSPEGSGFVSSGTAVMVIALHP